MDVHEKILGKKVGELIREVPSVLIVNVMIPDYPPEGGGLVNWRKYLRMGKVIKWRWCARYRIGREAFENERWKDLPPELSLLLRYIEGTDGKDGFDGPPHQCVTRQKTKVVVMVKGGSTSCIGRSWRFQKGTGNLS